MLERPPHWRTSTELPNGSMKEIMLLWVGEMSIVNLIFTFDYFRSWTVCIWPSSRDCQSLTIVGLQFITNWSYKSIARTTVLRRMSKILCRFIKILITQLIGRNTLPKSWQNIVESSRRAQSSKARSLLSTTLKTFCSIRCQRTEFKDSCRPWSWQCYLVLS